MIIIHIVAYLVIIIMNVLSYVGYYKDGLRAIKILAMCDFTVYSVCSMIFGVIVHQLVTKIWKSVHTQSPSLDH